MLRLRGFGVGFHPHERAVSLSSNLSSSLSSVTLLTVDPLSVGWRTP
jgi:hypothetical protein